LPPAIPPAWRSPHWALPLDGAMVIFLQIPANSTSPFSEISYENCSSPLQSPAAICLAALLVRPSIARSPTGPCLASISKMAESRSIIIWSRTPFGLPRSERKTCSFSAMPMPANTAPSPTPLSRVAAASLSRTPAMSRPPLWGFAKAVQ
jgi:hypothetical protein